MYQSCCSNLVPSISKCLNLPLVVKHSDQKTENKTLTYTQSPTTPPSKKGDKGEEVVDEIEDLFVLLSDIKHLYPTVKGVATGAILSNYQRCRVENVCGR